MRPRCWPGRSVCCRRPPSVRGGAASTSRSTDRLRTSRGVASPTPTARSSRWRCCCAIRSGLRRKPRPWSKRSQTHSPRAYARPTSSAVTSARAARAKRAKRCSAGCDRLPEDAPGEYSLCACQRSREVRAQILERFDPDRQADQSVGESGALARRGVHGRVRHGGRMRHQALHAAERLRQREVLEAADEFPYRVVSALELESDHGTETALLTPGQLVTGMPWEP